MMYVIVGLIIAVAVVVVVMIAKKDSKERDEMVSKLTEEQKEFLKATEVEYVEKNAWTQDIFADAGSSKFYIKDGACFVRANGTTNNGLASATSNDSNSNYGIWTVTETSTSGEYTIINNNSRQISLYNNSNWRSYGTTSGSKTNVKLYEKAKTAQTITASADSVYSDESVTLTTNATSATWSITSGASYAHLSSTSGKSVSLVGDAAGSVTVKAVASGYTDATKTITFNERPTGTYYDVTFNSNGGSSSPRNVRLEEENRSSGRDAYARLPAEKSLHRPLDRRPAGRSVRIWIPHSRQEFCQ